MKIPLRIVLDINVKDKPSTRVALLPLPSAPPQKRHVLKGNAHCPSYICGDCANPLVKGIRAKQFIDETRALESIGQSASPLRFASGSYALRDTLKMPVDHVVITSENGPLLIVCPNCRAVNEMITPNHTFERRRH